MRAVVQRVNSASVTVDGSVISEIRNGLLVLLSVEDADTVEDVAYMADKISNLRIFEDENEKMNHSLVDVNGDMLVVSQFTLHGDCRKGRRPSFTAAGKPDYANIMYQKFVEECKKYIDKVVTGQFQADMKVALVNDGPVTMLVDSKKIF